MAGAEGGGVKAALRFLPYYWWLPCTLHRSFLECNTIAFWSIDLQLADIDQFAMTAHTGCTIRNPGKER